MYLTQGGCGPIAIRVMIAAGAEAAWCGAISMPEHCSDSHRHRYDAHTNHYRYEPTLLHVPVLERWGLFATRETLFTVGARFAGS
jgi:hypothetical protein